MKNISAKAGEKIKTHCIFNYSFSPCKSCLLYDNVVKYGRAREATDDNIVRRMRSACCMNKTTDKHQEYVVFITFLQQCLR
jgi:hypothetical protein